MKNELKEALEYVLKQTFDTIDQIYKNVDHEQSIYNGSRLIFPRYRDKTRIRVSEQELRFIFVDQFIKYCMEQQGKFDYYYSVEVPTQYVYSFPHSNDMPPVVSKKDKGMQSASIDLAIFKKDYDDPVAIIEFKKDGCGAHEIAKDILKLSVEPSTELRYFIMISSSDTLLEKIAKNGNPSGLLKSLRDKLNNKCFQFDTKDLPCHEIDILWHRLPSNGEPQRNGSILPIDNYDFHAIYKDIGNQNTTGQDKLKILSGVKSS